MHFFFKVDFVLYENWAQYYYALDIIRAVCTERLFELLPMKCFWFSESWNCMLPSVVLTFWEKIKGTRKQRAKFDFFLRKLKSCIKCTRSFLSLSCSYKDEWNLQQLELFFATLLFIYLVVMERCNDRLHLQYNSIWWNCWLSSLSLIVALCYPVHFHLRIGFFWHLLLMTALSNFRYVWRRQLVCPLWSVLRSVRLT